MNQLSLRHDAKLVTYIPYKRATYWRWYFVRLKIVTYTPHKRGRVTYWRFRRWHFVKVKSVTYLDVPDVPRLRKTNESYCKRSPQPYSIRGEWHLMSTVKWRSNLIVSTSSWFFSSALWCDQIRSISRNSYLARKTLMSEQYNFM